MLNVDSPRVITRSLVRVLGCLVRAARHKLGRVVIKARGAEAARLRLVLALAVRRRRALGFSPQSRIDSDMDLKQVRFLGYEPDADQLCFAAATAS